MRSLKIRFYEWLDRQALRLTDLAAALSTFALRRRALACGCDVCRKAGNATGEARGHSSSSSRGGQGTSAQRCVRRRGIG